MADIKIVIDRESRRSLTDQLVDGLRAAVRLGRWKAGERLPTREELMAMCGVSRNVVQAAVRRLVAEGLVVTRPRLGCIVTRPSRRPIRGAVLHVDAGSHGMPYWNVVFSESFRRALSAERIDCRDIVLFYDDHDKLNSFDRGRLERELAKRPNVALVTASQTRRAGIQRILDAYDVPYVMACPSAPGRHPQMLWSGPCGECVGMDAFVADCVRSGIRSVMWLAACAKSGFNPCELLKKSGIAVEHLFLCRKPDGNAFGLRQFIELGRDRMLARMKRGCLCDLLFVADDHLALGAIPALIEGGVRIPEDLKLVTQYNKGFGLVLTKSLARIECDPAATAAEFARGVAEWTKTERFPELSLPPYVYVRGDTFPVPKG